MGRRLSWRSITGPPAGEDPNVGQAGSARHPTIAPGGARPTGHMVRAKSVPVTTYYAQPDPFAVQIAASLAIATNTASPMAHGQNVFRGDPGFAVNRFAGRIEPAIQNFGIPPGPILVPKSVRVGMQSGPSSNPAYPATTGLDSSGMTALAMMNGNVASW